MENGRVRRTVAGDMAVKSHYATAMLVLLPASDDDPIGLDEAYMRLRRRDGSRANTAVYKVNLLINQGLAESILPI